MEHTMASVENLPLLAKQLLQLAGERRKWLLYGGMGAGKTTLTSALCAQLGVVDKVSSPTFSLVNEYAMPENSGLLRHLDLYRLKTLEEALELGIEDMLYDAYYTIIEWPELIEPILPDNCFTLHLSLLPDGLHHLAVQSV
jgi:tRNA threonylcarbamoyladenosine biosynthesis protein TsaE